MFIPWFRGLVAKHITHVQAVSSSQTGKVLAITLLNNTDIDGNTLTNGKLDIIKNVRHSKDEELLERGKPRTLHITALTNNKVCAEELFALITSFPEAADGSNCKVHMFLSIVSKASKAISKLRLEQQKILKSLTRKRFHHFMNYS